MDKIPQDSRILRDFIPPLLFFASLICGLIATIEDSFCLIIDTGEIGVILALAIPAIIGIGYAIASISIFFLPLFLGKYYEADISGKAIENISGITGSPVPVPEKQLFFVTLFTYGILHSKAPGLLQWIGRRWNNFKISANCFVAHFFALFALAIVHLKIYWFPSAIKLSGALCYVFGWGVINTFILWVFYFNAKQSYKETMGMMEFAALNYNEKLAQMLSPSGPSKVEPK